jgi:hypothetical protein
MNLEKTMLPLTPYNLAYSDALASWSAKDGDEVRYEPLASSESAN